MKGNIETERDEAIRSKERAEERVAHLERELARSRERTEARHADLVRELAQAWRECTVRAAMSSIPARLTSDSSARLTGLPRGGYQYPGTDNVRPYESAPLASLALEKPGHDFAADFSAVVEYAIDNCWNEEDPRQAFGMPPEPYRLDYTQESSRSALIEHAQKTIAPGLAGWQRLYKEISDDQSKFLLLTVVAYRAIGWRYVKMPLDNVKFRTCLAEIAKSVDDVVSLSLGGISLRRVDLQRLGFDTKLFSDPFGVFNEFVYSQYVYRGAQKYFGPRRGDTVIDCGACFGGTSLFFASCVGPEGTVYSFEFMDDNVDVFSLNMGLNSDLRNRINLVKAPVWSKSGDAMYISGRGPSAQVTPQEIPGAKKVSSVSIDDLVQTHSIPRVDFIKMDIEGTEFAALSGAVETIKRFKPRLAICVYHQLMDFYELPLLVKEWNLEYKIYFQHSSVHGDETVFFAI